MPRLKNLKHEQFVQNFVKSPSATQAYQKTYNCQYESAHDNADRLTADARVQNRLLEVFKEKKLDDEWISERLSTLGNSAKKESVQLGAVRTVLEVRKDIDSATKIGINLNIETEKRDKILQRMNKYKTIIQGSESRKGKV